MQGLGLARVRKPKTAEVERREASVREGAWRSQAPAGLRHWPGIRMRKRPAPIGAPLPLLTRETLAKLGDLMTRENDDACLVRGPRPLLSIRHPEVPERSEGLEGRRPRCCNSRAVHPSRAAIARRKTRVNALMAAT